MAFHAKDFIYNGIPSEFYNLFLGEVSGSGESITATSSDITLLTQKLFRRPIPLFWGAEQQPVLSFPLNMYSPDELSAEDFSKISGWLFGQQNYSKLYICQNDMQEIWFDCFLTAPQIIRIGNIIQGITCTVIANAPWGWKNPKTVSYTFPDYQTIVENIVFYNYSANAFYTYPTELIITANVFGGSVTIRNTSDNNRDFILTLLPNEEVTIDCDIQTIISDTLDYPLSGFNKHWLRLIQGYNALTVTGNVTDISITAPVAAKIGG